MTVEIKPKYLVGQPVWSRVGDFQKGIVIDWSYQRRTNTITYQVTFDPASTSLWYFEEELSDAQIFN